MFTKIFQVLTQYLSPRDTVIVAVSGGPDSSALLNSFYKLQATSYKLKIVVAHVNHGIRGKESDADERFVRRLAKKYGLVCEVKKVKLAGKTHLEERGRDIRREFFEKLRKKHKAKWILTAHTEDDQIETIVFSFLRGSGPAGLAGMKMREGFYLKPFLNIKKSEILRYLRANKLKFRKDSTNEDMRFTRNFIRKKLLPLCARINPSFRETITRNSRIFRQLDCWLREEAAAFLKTHRKGRLLFNRKDFMALPDALKFAVIREAHRQVYQLKKNSYALPLVKILEVSRLIERGIGNKKIICKGGGTFFLKKGWLKMRIL